MSDTIQLESLDAYEEDTLVDLHVCFSGPVPELAEPRPGDATRVVEFAELARLLDRKAVIGGT
jgi:hypothetical protein